jgi:hypothetical protein
LGIAPQRHPVLNLLLRHRAYCSFAASAKFDSSLYTTLNACNPFCYDRNLLGRSSSWLVKVFRLRLARAFRLGKVEKIKKERKKERKKEGARSRHVVFVFVFVFVVVVVVVFVFVVVIVHA